MVEKWLPILGRYCVEKTLAYESRFQFILGEIEDQLVKEPTRFKPEPIPPDTQLGICLYRLAHRCTYSTVGDLFGVAESTMSVIFNQVCKILVSNLYDRFVYLPRNRFLWAAVGAPGSTHDSRLLKSCDHFAEIQQGHVFPNTVLRTREYRDIPFTTVGDSAFPRYTWLMKPYSENTRDPRKHYLNKRLCSC